MSEALRLLLVLPRYPFPARRGDQRRALQALEALAPRHQVTVLAPEPPTDLSAKQQAEVDLEVGRFRRLGVQWDSYHPAGRLRRGWSLLRTAPSDLPFQCGLFGSPALRPKLAAKLPEVDLTIFQLVRLAPWLAQVEGPLLVDLVDSLSLSTGLRAELDRPGWAKVCRTEAARLARWEGRLAERAERTLVVAERDRRAVVEAAPGAAERVRVLPVAVPVSEDGARPAGAEGGRRTLVVTGNLGYFPTEEGLRWFLDEVWPRLEPERLDLHLTLAGTRVPRWLVRRERRMPRVTLQQDPADLAPVLAEATIALAPMRGGAGQPLKVCEAWAAGVPVVATPWAAAGTTGRQGEDLIVAEDAEAWVAAIRGLLAQPERARRIAEAAARRLANDYAPESVEEGWRAVVEEAVFEGRESRGGREALDALAARSRA